MQNLYSLSLSSSYHFKLLRALAFRCQSGTRPRAFSSSITPSPSNTFLPRSPAIFDRGGWRTRGRRGNVERRWRQTSWCWGQRWGNVEASEIMDFRRRVLDLDQHMIFIIHPVQLNLIQLLFNVISFPRSCYDGSAQLTWGRLCWGFGDYGSCAPLGGEYSISTT